MVICGILASNKMCLLVLGVREVEINAIKEIKIHNCLKQWCVMCIWYVLKLLATDDILDFIDKNGIIYIYKFISRKFMVNEI